VDQDSSPYAGVLTSGLDSQQVANHARRTRPLRPALPECSCF